jgi:hypothetical protein
MWHAQVAGDASIELQLSASNAVKALALRVDSLPAEGCRAGSSVTLCAEVLHAPIPRHILEQGMQCLALQQSSATMHNQIVSGMLLKDLKRIVQDVSCVQVTTEDGAPLDADAAAQSLALRLTPPGSGRADEIILSPSEGPPTPLSSAAPPEVPLHKDIWP